MKLFLIAGRARSGKTETAKLLKTMLEHRGLKVSITEYSKYIKLFAKELTNWDGVSELKPRRFLQDFGSFIRESKHADYFIRRMKEDLLIYEEIVDVLIISDVRLPSEIEELKSYSPITIYVKNDSNFYDLNEVESSHETEHALDNYENFQYSIINQTPKEIERILKNILRKELNL